TIRSALRPAALGVSSERHHPGNTTRSGSLSADRKVCGTSCAGNAAAGTAHASLDAFHRVPVAFQATGRTVSLKREAANGAGVTARNQLRAESMVPASESHQARRISAAPQALGSIT